MKRPIFALAALAALAVVAVLVVAAQESRSSYAFHQGGLVLLNSHLFERIDPASGGRVLIRQEVFEGCSDGHEHDMTFKYHVFNVDYDPQPGTTNGFSGFQVIFPGPVPELHHIQSPAVGGPWVINGFSGVIDGVEWDVPGVGDVGIMPGEAGDFSFCTDEREDVVVNDPPENGGFGFGSGGWSHTWSLITEAIIDADGTATAGDGIPAAVEVTVGTALATFPDGGAHSSGLDMFDNDLDGQWTFGPAGDDLHLEATEFCPGAQRDGRHDLGIDCKVLDLDGGLADQTPVNCDLEFLLADPIGAAPGSSCPTNVKYFDADGDGAYDNGEDLVLDANDNGVFDGFRTQTFIHNGPISVPGDLLFTLDIACDSANPIADHELCKKVKYLDEDRDGIIEVGEPVDFLVVFQVHHPADVNSDWTSTTVEDRFGAELDVTCETPSHGNVDLSTKGESDKVFLKWDIGTLPAGETATLACEAHTDLNPAGHQEYSECSLHEFNSGAVLKFLNPQGKQRSFQTGGISVSVLTPDLAGDCDGDGFTDAEELEAGTDPHDPLSFPVEGCAGAVFDICVDGDGIASAGPGAFQILVGDPILPASAGGNPAGLDLIDRVVINGVYDAGDDLMVEDPLGTPTCPTAARNAIYDNDPLGILPPFFFPAVDCVVLDPDGSLAHGDFVTCDAGAGCGLSFRDDDSDGRYDEGEDLVVDVNGNGVFD